MGIAVLLWTRKPGCGWPMGHSLPVPASNKGYLSRKTRKACGRKSPGLTDLATQPTYPLPSAAVLVVTKWLPQLQRYTQATTSSSRKGACEASATTGASEAPQGRSPRRGHQAWPARVPSLLSHSTSQSPSQETILPLQVNPVHMGANLRAFQSTRDMRTHP